MKKICFVVAVPLTANVFLKDHIEALKEYFQVAIVANISSKEEISDLPVSDYKSIQILRGISVFKDIKTTYKLYQYFKKENFTAVHSVTPKAGLITALAAFFARIPHRIHIFTGQVWATKKGFSRWMLMLLDLLIAQLNNHILVDGHSQREYLMKNKIVSPHKSKVLLNGSISGVNTTRFCPSDEIRKSERSKFGISDEKVVYAFLGRLNKEKGIFELFEAFDKLASINGNAYLLIIGFDEESCLSKISNYKNIKESVNFKYYGSTKTPEKALQAGDVFCLPSYREGFGSSVLEASCLGLPVICSDVYGLQDAFIDNQTGYRCIVRNSTSLYFAMMKFINAPDLIKELGANGRKMVLNNYDSKIISKEWVSYYKHFMGCE